jgi:hypothetical protein
MDVEIPVASMLASGTLIALLTAPKELEECGWSVFF